MQVIEFVKLISEMKVIGEKGTEVTDPASSTDPKTCSKDLSWSMPVRTRKMANYVCIG